MTVRKSYWKSARRIAHIVTLATLTAGVGVQLARAEESTSVEVTFSVQEAGTFSVTLQAVNSSDPLTFGTVPLDADQDKVVSQSFVLSYVDTLTSRSAGEVSISVGSFEPVTPVPAFSGSEFAHFQIPNRYLVISDIGDVVVAPDGPVCATGPISAATADEGSSFDNGASHQVATIEAGCGVGTASQPIQLTLTVPAGAYPTSYAAMVTIETTVQ